MLYIEMIPSLWLYILEMFPFTRGSNLGSCLMSTLITMTDDFEIFIVVCLLFIGCEWFKLRFCY